MQGALGLDLETLRGAQEGQLGDWAVRGPQTTERYSVETARELARMVAWCPLHVGLTVGTFCSSITVLSEKNRGVAGSGVPGGGLNKGGDCSSHTGMSLRALQGLGRAAELGRSLVITSWQDCPRPFLRESLRLIP